MRLCQQTFDYKIQGINMHMEYNIPFSFSKNHCSYQGFLYLDVKRVLVLFYPNKDGKKVVHSQCSLPMDESIVGIIKSLICYLLILN